MCPRRVEKVASLELLYGAASARNLQDCTHCIGFPVLADPGVEPVSPGLTAGLLSTALPG